MSDLQVNNPSMGLFLTPPGAEGEAYSNNVTFINGKPLGEGSSTSQNTLINSALGYTDTDSLESATEGTNEVTTALSGFNIGVQLDKNLSPEQQLQQQVDDLDPSNPVAPIILKYVKIADDSLKSGDLAGVSVHYVAKDQAETQAQKGDGTGTIPGTPPPQTDQVNPEALPQTPSQVISQNTVQSQTETGGEVAAITQTSSTDNSQIAPTVVAPQNVTQGQAETVKATAATAQVSSTDQIGVKFDTSLQTEETSAVVKRTNPWLSGNAYTQFLVSFFELLRSLKQMKEIDSKLELQGMAQIYDLAKQSADTIIAAAKERAMMHISQAIIAGVSMAFTLGMTAFSVFQATKFKVEEAGGYLKDANGQTVKDTQTGNPIKTGAWDKNGAMTAEAAKHYNKDLTYGARGTSTIQMGYIAGFNSGTKAMDSMVQAIFEVEAAQYDALKEILQAYRTIAQQQMDRASEGFKSESDLITQVIQQLDQIRQKLMEAIAANLRKG